MLSTTVCLAIFISLLQMFFVMDSKASLVFCVEILICTCIELKKLGGKNLFCLDKRQLLEDVCHDTVWWRNQRWYNLKLALWQSTKWKSSCDSTLTIFVKKYPCQTDTSGCGDVNSVNDAASAIKFPPSAPSPHDQVIRWQSPFVA